MSDAATTEPAGVEPDGPVKLPAARRRRMTGRRERVVGVRLSDAERAEVVAAAGAAGLTPAGYAAEVTLAAARGEGTPRVVGSAALREALVELALARTQVRRLGVNLNQAVAALHSTGEVPEQLAVVAERAGRAVERLDWATAAVAQAVRR
jgi:hypothetical protein